MNSASRAARVPGSEAERSIFLMAGSPYIAQRAIQRGWEARTAASEAGEPAAPSSLAMVLR